MVVHISDHFEDGTPLTVLIQATKTRALRYLGIAVILVGLYLSSRYSYTLFHSLAEFFGVAVAAGVFSIVWNARGIFRNDYLLLLGVALLPIAFVDILHTLAYQGLSVFPGYDNDLPTQLWLVGRYLQTLAFLAAPLVLRRRGRAELYLAAFGLLTLILVPLVFAGLFPSAYDAETGLTTFKVVSEYAIAVLLLAALALLFRERKTFDRGVFARLAGSIVVTIVAEMLFTLYVSPDGPSNLAGHLLKFIAFYLVYRAVIVTALRNPYTLLFRELKQSEEALRSREAQQRHIADVLQEALLTVPREIPGLVFSHLYHPAAVASRVGGDFYDVFTLPGGGVGLVMGDISGHGLEAAALTAASKSTIKAFAMEGKTPRAVLENTNLVMLNAGQDGQPRDRGFLTAFYGVIEPGTGILQFASAGHPPAVVRRASGKMEMLECPSPVAGVFEDARYSDCTARLSRGDVLLLYTDGLTEACLDGHLLGEDKLLDFLATHPDIPAARLPEALFTRLLERQGYERRDDLAILAVELADPRRPDHRAADQQSINR